MLGQKSVAGEGIGPGEEATAVILLNVQIFMFTPIHYCVDKGYFLLQRMTVIAETHTGQNDKHKCLLI